ncbi:PepSY domain-containing protein [Colwellia ponticola]|nr:PepSY domain-containing protein [Colwellia ponticola]
MKKAKTETETKGKIMKNKLVIMLIASCLVSGTALADDDCTDPVSQWQPRDQLRQMIEDKGWKVKQIKVDDGCYKVKGVDRKGNRIKATFFPASLKIRELKIKFDQSADASDYLDLATPMTSESNKQKNKPKVTID